MFSTFRMKDPGEMECTMTITMTLDQWRDLSKQLSNSHPSWKLGGYINNMIIIATKVFTSDEQKISEP